jgi:hypothetical protein
VYSLNWHTLLPIWHILFILLILIL